MMRDPFEQRVRPSAQPPELSINGYLPTGSEHRRPAPAPAGGANALEAAFDRLEAVIDEENEALTNKARPDFADINRRKSQSLLELTRLGRALPIGAGPVLRDRIVRLNDKLRGNHRALSTHLS